MSTDLVPKSSKKYCCENCDYYTFRKSQYDRHLTTDKHLNQEKSTFSNQKVPKSSAAFECVCGKKYKDKSGLWRHKKNCLIKEENTVEPENNNNNNISPEMILNIIQQNQEFKDLLLEQNKIMLEMSKNSNTTNINTIAPTDNLRTTTIGATSGLFDTNIALNGKTTISKLLERSPDFRFNSTK